MTSTSGRDFNDNGESFFSTIRRTYGDNSYQQFKNFTKEINRLARLTARKQFLITCRRENLVPSHIVRNINCVFQTVERNTPYNNEIEKTITSFRKKLLNIEIKTTFWDIRQIELALENTRRWITTMNNHDIHLTNEFFASQENTRDKQHNKCVRRLEYKLEALKRSQLDAYIGAKTDSFVFNATDVSIPKEAMMIMGLGPKFGLPVKTEDIPVPEIIADVEHALYNVPDTGQKNLVRSDVTQILARALNSSQRRTNFDQFINKQLNAYTNFMKSHPELMCIKADKGGKTVCMFTDDYKQKTTDMLNDQSTY